MHMQDRRRWRSCTLAAAMIGLASLVAGCGGGGKAAPQPAPIVQYSVGGTVSGLRQGATLTLANGAQQLAVHANGRFAFANKENNGAAYAVSASAPAGYNCKVSDGAGVVAGADVSRVSVACAPVVLTGAQSVLQLPLAVAVDRTGNTYVLDEASHSVRMIDAAGKVSTLAGGQPGFADGQGAAARFHFGLGSALAIDAQDDLYISDTCNGAIRKVTLDGEVSTLAGQGTPACKPSYDMGAHQVDGGKEAARFELPGALVANRLGTVYVIDAINSGAIRRVDSRGGVTTIPLAFAAGDGVTLRSIAQSPDGNMYVADAQRIWKLVGTVPVLLAGRMDGYTSLDGSGSAARFSGIAGMTVAPNGDLYVAEPSVIRKVTPAGVVTTIAGGRQREGAADGQGSGARFDWATAIAAAGENLLVIDGGERILRRVTPAGEVTTLAATPPVRGHVDGSAGLARLNAVSSLAADADGNVYFADTELQVIRKAAPDGSVSTVAGHANLAGLTDGPLASAYLFDPVQLAVASDGSLWIGQRRGLRRLQNGIVTTVDPWLEAGSIAIDERGNAVVTTTVDGRFAVVRVTPDGARTTLVDTGAVVQLLGNNRASFVPLAVAVNAAGDVFVADADSSAVFRLSKAGQLGVFAGTPYNSAGKVDGPPGTATLDFYPDVSMAIDDAGNLYLGAGTVRRISATGVVSSPAVGWGAAPVTALAVAGGKLYGFTHYALLQAWLP